MENDTIWEHLIKLPELLNEYSSYSYPLLLVLLIASIVIICLHTYRKKKAEEGLGRLVLSFAAVLMFLSLGGFFLKYVGSVSTDKAREDYIASHRAPKDEHWLMVFDFTLPPGNDETKRQLYLARMKNLVATMSEVLLEGLPAEFSQPRVVHMTTGGSPWQEGVGQNNYDKIIKELNAFQLIWGNVLEQGEHAKLFLGVSEQLASDLDAIIPLRDFSFLQDPRREHLFGDGYYRLLGLVTLGLALDTYRQAHSSDGDERKKKFLQAAAQFNKARETVNNRRDDPMLQRNLYSTKVDVMIDTALKEAGLNL